MKMRLVKKSESVPKGMHNLFIMLFTLCRKRPCPLEKGKESSWACGITHAIGSVSFVFDKSQTP
jgi:hypothetical protein